MKYIIVDERISAAAEASLSELGFTVFKLPSHKRLPEAVRSHTDMLLFKVGDKIFTPKEYRDENPELFRLIEKSSPLEFIYTDDTLGGEYPLDAKFNCLIMGKKAFLNKRNISSKILDYLVTQGFEIHDTKQGYPACTVLPICENTAVTADRGMAKALGRAGIEVILTENSRAVSLFPHEFGFIGGSCHKSGNDFLFFGNAPSFEHYGVLQTLIKSTGGRIISLDSAAGALFDLGGAVSYDKSV